MEINRLKLSSPIPPSVNHYLAYRVVSTHGKHLAVSYKTKEAKNYQLQFSKYVREQIELQNYSLEPNKERHFYIDAVFYFDRIDVDANNYFKVMLDTITDTGLIWIDDNVTCERVQRIYYDSKNPRVELEIYPVDYIGVFDNEKQLMEFEGKCQKCSRYSRNCSILKKAKEGRIQEEIYNNSCSKFKEKKEK